MFILKANNLAVEIAGQKLFENVSIEIKEQERIALIGENGIGKTTLIKVLLGRLPAQSGHVQYGVNKKEIGYIVQENQRDNGTVMDFVIANHPNAVIKNELTHYSQLLAEQPEDLQVIEEYNKRLQKYLDVHGYDWEMNVEKTLKQLGIPEPLWNLPYANLSGGQKTRVKLARVLLQSPKLIILDEPTNHLDIESIHWLEDWLLNFKGSVLFISHEREFIDHVATSTYELTKSGTKKYSGGYFSYKQQKEHEYKTMQKLYEKQEKERKKLLETITQYKQWYDKANAGASVRDPYAQKKAAKQATKMKAKEKVLERLEKEKIDKPELTKTISTNFVSDDFGGRKMLELINVTFSYSTMPIFSNVYLELNWRDRLAVVGPNGSGKTTLLQLMAGILEPDCGQVRRNPQLKIGYFFQELENLNFENSILDEILMIPNITQADARTILACFLFRREDVFKKISTLSMGEKCRVAFVKLYFSNANLLVLDEPTNYFDIPTRETIENALIVYPGSIVLVAHDPYLLRKVANKVAYIKKGKVDYYPGSYHEWEKHQTFSNPVQLMMNKLEKLQLRYTQLIMEENVDPAQEESRLAEIKKIRVEIEEIEKKLNGS
ncbi:ABC-F type ribosomal protection protein [Caldifermentibacillus hisashii]|uniref:ribosomal protection-like ABC-F family protein n=1 Tax=Caldifermentibacillus hisashii TaxID=996558 RepID=UPI002E1EEFAC|nr:ABC-F type ribosomal protection protein [Caldifermentibacillus hisashii]MED3643991.1 ABC-F type ribosomal protection protein [Caldifermentibacillus hisashii]